MPIDLTKPLAWTRASLEEQAMLQSLQGNILKGHGRVETTHVFFRIDPSRAHAMRRSLRAMASFHVTSAHRQLLETEAFKASGEPGATFVSVMLSRTGYAAIERAGAAPTETAFVNGMRQPDSDGNVGDDVAQWQPAFRQQLDGMVLIADDERNGVRLKRDAIAGLLTDGGATIVHEQRGSAIKNHAGEGIEHFGYVDGRSQPLLLVEDIERESSDGGIARWDPAFALDRALVPDPGAPGNVSFGSYFVFRKLEQDVRGFKRQEQVIATALNFSEDDRERAGALAVGRFEDGTPITLADEAIGARPVNDFNYVGDGTASNDRGLRCPFHAHIRKVNPRTPIADRPNERLHIMPRRGIPYEDVPRLVHPSDVPESASVQDFDARVAPLLPTGDVGLLFMAYNASLRDQFVFTQKSWANNPGFPTGTTGIDPVIAQGATPSGPQRWPKRWDDPTSDLVLAPFRGFVTMRGGEYFFAPSLTFLKNL